MAQREISDESVKAKTGKVWSEWFGILDAWGAVERGHTATAKHLHEEHGVSGWWAQTVTIRHEQARGVRKLGQTCDGAWATSTQKTLPVDAMDAWSAVVAPDALARWLGSAESLDFAEGGRYRLTDGAEGEFRAIRPGKLLRFNWEHPEMTGRSTVDVTFFASKPGKTAVRIQHEKIGSESERETMKTRWKDALTTIASLCG